MEANKKSLILEALHRDGRAQTVQDLVRWTKGLDHGLDAREITKLLWSLQKLGYIKFVERRQELVKIDLTPKAVAEFWPKPKREEAPVERINTPPKPKIIPSPEYRVPDPPRYSAPPPPPQNIKPFTDEGSDTQKREEVTGSAKKEHVVDTHTQYFAGDRVAEEQRDMSYLREVVDLYPHAKGAGGRATRMRALEFVKSIINVGGDGQTLTEVTKLMGSSNFGGQFSVLTQVAKHFEYLAPIESGDRRVLVTDKGRIETEQYSGYLRDEKIVKPVSAIPPVDLQTDNRKKVEPLPVVRRDEADAERKAPDLSQAKPEAINKLIPHLDDYPLIQELMGKEGRARKYEQAAEILLEVDENAATNLLSRVEISDLEREVIRYVKTTQE